MSTLTVDLLELSNKLRVMCFMNKITPLEFHAVTVQGGSPHQNIDWAEGFQHQRCLFFVKDPSVPYIIYHLDGAPVLQRYLT